jgi:hypothetical protein
MTFWFSADCITYTSSVCGVPSTGTGLTGWADRSGNANNLTPKYSTCTFNTAEVNGLPAVAFSGCVLALGTVVPASSGHTAFVVYETTALSGGNLIASDVGSYVGGAWTQCGYDYLMPGTYSTQTVNSQNCINIGNSTDNVTSGAWTQVNSVMQNNSAGWIMNFRMHEAADPYTPGPTSYNMIDITADGPWYIGGSWFWGGPSGQFAGKVAEIIFYNQTLTLTQIQQVEAYLYSKYGV